MVWFEILWSTLPTTYRSSPSRWPTKLNLAVSPVIAPFAIGKKARYGWIRAEMGTLVLAPQGSLPTLTHRRPLRASGDNVSELCEMPFDSLTVSYTHLTLPTNR